MQTWSEAIAAARKVLEELAQALDGVEAPDIPVLTASLEAAEQAALASTELRTRAEEAIGRFDTERGVHQGALTALREAVAARAGIVALDDVLSATMPW